MTNSSAKNTRTIQLTMTALMAAVICILGPITIPLPVSPVPISFTNLAIYLTVMLIGWKRGTVSYLIYLCIGLIGVPVFSAFSGGPGKLFGPTGGYLIGFIFMTLIAGWFVDRFDGKKSMAFLGMILGTIATYAFGTAWLAYQADLSFGAALAAGVIPFIPGDLIKVVIGLYLGSILRNRLQKAGVL